MIAPDRPVELPSTGAAVRALSGLGGIAISAAILLALFYAQGSPPDRPLITTQEVRAVSLPPPPPPPTVTAREPPPPELMDMAPVPSTSPVKFALTIDPVPVPQLRAAPRIEFARDAFKPKARNLELNPHRVYNVQEVDRLPVPVFRKPPKIPPAMVRAAKQPIVRLTFVVNVRGEVEDVRVVQADTPEFGRLVAESVTAWRFEPALKDGRRVPCVVLQPIRVHPPSGSPFSTR